MTTMPFTSVVTDLCSIKEGVLTSHNDERVKFVRYSDEYGSDNLEMIGVESGLSSFITSETNPAKVKVDGNSYHLKFLERGKTFNMVVKVA
jgi:hypothetical protein